MLDAIKQILFTKYKPEELKGVFISTFDKNNLLISSNGVLESDKPLGQTVELLYNGLLANNSNIKTIMIDVVTDVREEKDMKELMSLDHKKYGICLVAQGDASKSGVILPNTQGINSIQEAIITTQRKNQLPPKVFIYIFTTDRMAINI